MGRVFDCLIRRSRDDHGLHWLLLLLCFCESIRWVYRRCWEDLCAYASLVMREVTAKSIEIQKIVFSAVSPSHRSFWS